MDRKSCIQKDTEGGCLKRAPFFYGVFFVKWLLLRKNPSSLPKHPTEKVPQNESLSDLHGLITRGLVLIKKGDASPSKDFKHSNLKYAKYS